MTMVNNNSRFCYFTFLLAFHFFLRRWSSWNVPSSFCSAVRLNNDDDSRHHGIESSRQLRSSLGNNTYHPSINIPRFQKQASDRFRRLLAKQEELGEQIIQQPQSPSIHGRRMIKTTKESSETSSSMPSFIESLQHISSVHYNKEDDHNEKNNTTTNIIIIECQTQPLFHCTKNQNKQQPQRTQEKYCHTIKEQIYQEHEIVLQSLQEKYDILLQTHRLFNGIVVRIHHTKNEHDHIHRRMKEIKEVKRIWSHHNYLIYHDHENDSTGIRRLQTNIRKRLLNNKQTNFHQSNTTTTTTTKTTKTRRLQDDDGCTSTWTGKGIVVGLLDTGIDYTHSDFGGPGTVDAYINAYGLDGNDARNKQRDGLFPTSKVIDGYDFVGDVVNEDGEAIHDDDPIDSAGHGTAVASGVLQEAPDVTFIAAKACQSTPTGATCPTTALIAAIEYLLDPNNDENMDDKVNVITLSLGADYNNPAHDLVSLMLEYATEMGVVVVTSFGNRGNIPYVAGAIGTTPNVISVGATNNELGPISGMEWYTSRGPGINNVMKPDISAPSNTLVAVAGTGNQYQSFEGTSFVSPLVTGAVARLLEKCNGSCSPFAIKALLMNYADRNVLYSTDEEEGVDPLRLAPLTRLGSGEYNSEKALEESRFWAYSVDDVQPAINLGFFVDIDQDLVLQRTIKITNLMSDGEPFPLSMRAEFRDPEKGASGVVGVSFDTDAADLSTVSCQDSISIVVTFSINTSFMPANSLSSSGKDGINPGDFDRHEYGGHIIIANSDSVEASIPFLMILRKAARPEVKTGTVLASLYGPVDTPIEITNNGAGIAQIDAYQLILSSPDEEEASYGTELLSADVRAVGYRILPVPNSKCQYLVEFSIELWEQIRYIGEVTIGVDIYQDMDLPPVTLWIRTIPFSSDALIIYSDGTIACTGFHPDHGSNSGNIVIRACSSDLLLSESGTIFVQFSTAKYPLSVSTLWTSDVAEIPFPTPNLQADSYDIAPGETLSEFRVTGTIDRTTVGMHLVTSAYRDSSRTGAATRDTESLFVLRDGIVLQQETTIDSIIPFPIAQGFSGPDCTWYGQIPPTKVCQERNTGTPANVRSTNSDSIHMVLPMQQQENDLPIDIDDLPDCQPVEVPRLTVPTYGPTEKPTTSSPISVEPPTTTEPALTTPSPSTMVSESTEIPSAPQDSAACSINQPSGSCWNIILAAMTILLFIK